MLKGSLSTLESEIRDATKKSVSGLISLKSRCVSLTAIVGDALLRRSMMVKLTLKCCVASAVWTKKWMTSLSKCR